MSTQTLARLAGAGRIALGASIWLLPDQAMGVLGFDADNPQEMALGRVAGTRDIALGAAAMATAGDPRGGAAMARLNAFVDAGDAVAFGSAFLRREGIDRAALGGLVAGASAAAFGLWLAERLAA